MGEPPLLTRDQVVQRLHESGVDVDLGDLRYWEQKGSLPHPIRQRHEGATRAVYPEWYVHLVKLLRQLQAHKRSLNEIGAILRWHVRQTFATGDRLEDVQLTHTMHPTDHNPVEAFQDALNDYTAWYERTYRTAPVRVVVVSFFGEGGQILLDADGRPMRAIMEVEASDTLHIPPRSDSE